MLFSSVLFLFYFLPLTLLAYYLLPKSCKNAVLLAASLLFYAWGEPAFLPVLLFSIVWGYGCGIWIARAASRRTAKMFLALSCIVSIGILTYFKYADFLVENLNTLTGLSIPLPRVTLPIGISFFTFQVLSYTIDVYRKQVEPQRSMVAFAAYVSMFPQLVAGPIVRYADVAAQLEQRSVNWSGIGAGLQRFLVGLGKKVLLADSLAQLVVFYQSNTEPSILFAWLSAIAFTLQIYLDFSGYSDMAIGLGRLFGFTFCENFDQPYLSKSITEFWRRWHISLGSWFRDYVYIPLGGNRVPRWRWIWNLTVAWALTGLWHGAAWNFVVWGLSFAVILAVEKLFLHRILKKLPAAIQHFYVLFLVILSFVIFQADSLQQALQQLQAMFSFVTLPAVSTTTLYALRNYAGPLIFAVLVVLPQPRQLAQRIGQTKAGAVLQPVVLIGLLLLCTAFLVDGSFQPFLYFRF